MRPYALFCPLLAASCATPVFAPVVSPPTTSLIAPPSAPAPIFLALGAVWCAPCRDLEAHVFPDPRVVRALEGFRVQHYDVEVGHGVDVAARFRVDSLPALVVLSPDGREVDRVHAQSPDGIVRALDDVRAIAARFPARDADFDEERDARMLLAIARAAERESPPALDRAARAYRAAVAADPKDERGAASQAAFALLRWAARVDEARAHAKLLLQFASRYPASGNALHAIAGVAALAPEARADATERRAAEAKVIAAHAASRDAFGLRWIASACDAMSDAAEAKRARAEADAIDPTNANAPPRGMATADPLAPPPAAGAMSVPPDFRKQMESARRIADACKATPHAEAIAYVRVAVQDGRVTRARHLDPDAPPELTACLEAAAMRETGLPASMGERQVLQVMLGAPLH